MQTVLIAIHLMVVVALVAVVLLQRSEGGALGMGGGGGFMTGRGQANVLTRATGILAALFFATSLGLTLLANYGHSNKSILEGVTPGATSQPASTLPPKGQGSVLDQLQQIEQQRATGAQGAFHGATPNPQAPSTATPAPVTQKAPVEPTGMPSTPSAQVPSSPTPKSDMPAGK